MAVRIPLITDFDGRGIQRAMREFKQLEGSAAKTKFALQKAFLPAAAALTGLAVAGGKAAMAAIQDEKAQALLAGQLRRTTGATQQQIAEIENWIDAQGRFLGVADDDLRPVISQLSTATGNLADSTKLASLAMDIAATTGKPLAQVSEALGRAYNGQYLALRRLDPSLSGLIKTGASADQVFGSLQEKFGGAAQANAETTAGKYQILQVRLGELQETIGAALLPAIDALLPLLTAFANWAQNNSGVFVAISAIIGSLAVAVIAANAAVKAWNSLTIITAGLNAKLGTSFTRLQTALGGVGLVLGAATAIYMSVKGAKDKLKQSTEGLIDVLKLEAGAQEDALAQLVATDGNTKKLIQTLEKVGLSFNDVRQYVETGTGALDLSNKQFTNLRKQLGLTTIELGVILQPLADMRKAFLDNAEAARLAGATIANPYKGFDVVKYYARQGVKIGETTTATAKLADTSSKAADKMREAFSRARAGITDALNAIIAKRDEYAATIADAVRSTVNFFGIYTTAKEAGTTFMAGLTESVAKAKTFATRLQQLLRAGLSQDALAQVAQAGADAGVAIADELLAGGAATIGQANDLVAAAQKAAMDTGTLAGATYYNEGTVLAQQLTKGITDVISKYKIKLSSPGLTEKQLNRLRNRFALDVDFVMSQVPALAQGGIVASPTLALIGEAGPEAVVPLDKMGQMGNVTINVNGGDPNAVVDALRTYMRQNGSVPIRVSNLY
jgi:hypothetical protein